MNKTKDFLSDLVVNIKYAKYIQEEQRKEVWSETIERCIELFNTQLLKLSNGYHNDIGFDNIEKIKRYVLNKTLLPSMRCLQFASQPIMDKNHRIYNCSYKTINTPQSFHELFYLLLLGCGVGYSVQRHHIDQLPKLNNIIYNINHVIEDSIEGWANAVNILISGAFEGIRVSFDYSKIRPAGMLLKSSIGYSQGPEVLMKSLNRIKDILYNYSGKKLTPLAVHDIICLLSLSIINGGTRRAAMLSIFSHDDQEMLNCKQGNFYEHNGQRAMANNSAYLDIDNTSFDFFSKFMGNIKNNATGEPGFIWVKDFNSGYNPCCEVSLEDKGVCNLVTINTSVFKDLTIKEHKEVLYISGFLGGLQSTFNKTNFLPTDYYDVAKQQSLLGISLMGIQDLKNATSSSTFTAIENYFLVNSSYDNAMKDIATGLFDLNTIIKNEYTMKPKRFTCIKPDGSTSLLCKTTSGISPSFSEYYIRRVRINKNNGIINTLFNKNKDFINVDKYNPNDYVVDIPIHCENYKKMYYNDELDEIKKYNKWIINGHRSGMNTNNISYTLKYNDMNFNAIIRRLYDDRKYYNGISLFPEDNTVYEQAPFEKIDKDTYKKLYDKFVPIDFYNISEVKSNQIYNMDMACGGKGCDI